MPIRITKGLEIPLAGPPAPSLADVPGGGIITIYPREFDRIRHRLAVSEGDPIRRGGVLFRDKKNEAWRFCSPASGRIRSIVMGERRALDQIIIETAADELVEPFPRHAPERLLQLDRGAVLEPLLNSGLFALIRQRPFARMADPSAAPRAIFVNGMNTAPFGADIQVAIRGYETAWRAGLNALTRLTEGRVHLCLAADAPQSVAASTTAPNVIVHHFAGPHPAGNTSVHIHHIAPLRPGEVLWTIRAVDVVQIGRLFTDGAVPADRIVALGGPGVRQGARQHYRMRIGAPLAALLDGRLEPGEQRVIAGDALAGVARDPAAALGFFDSSFTVLPEGRTRFFMGWAGPGLNIYSRSRAFLSRWLRRGRRWPLDTNTHGSPRAMVLTGLYDQYVPLNIMTDFLLRAVLAHDTDEAVKLGILETAPEDFALCSFVCPSKTDVMGIIRRGLEEIEKEGL